MQRRFTYPVTLTVDVDVGGYVVTCRDLSEAITQGDNREEALESAEGALEAAIEMRIEDGLEIPIPSKAEKGEYLAALPVGSAMKAAVYLAMKEQGINKTDLIQRLNLNEKEASSILGPKNLTKIHMLERVLHALGKRVEIIVV
jgi:antitoxin HicB